MQDRLELQGLNARATSRGRYGLRQQGTLRPASREQDARRAADGRPAAVSFDDRHPGVDAAAGRRWYAVHTHANRESTAARYLAYQGFAVFLPQRFKTRRHARKIETVLAAYFPCYLFVSFDPDRDRWRSINGTFGVRHLVMSGAAPDPVPAGLVEQMIDRTDGAGILCLQDDMASGEEVMVTAGPFADIVGRLEDLGPDERVRVLLDILGGVSTTLPRNGVAPVVR